MAKPTLSIHKLQQKITRFVEKHSTRPNRKQSPSINAMTAVLLIYRKEATSTANIANALGKTEPSVKALLRSLSTGSSRGRTGYEFVTKTRSYNLEKKCSQNEYYLTLNGKKFARLIEPFFEG